MMLGQAAEDGHGLVAAAVVHPRCPALASGAAAAAGIDDRCRNEAVPILRGVAEHHAACFLTDESVKKESGPRVGR